VFRTGLNEPEFRYGSKIFTAFAAEVEGGKPERSCILFLVLSGSFVLPLFLGNNEHKVTKSGTHYSSFALLLYRYGVDCPATSTCTNSKSGTQFRTFSSAQDLYMRGIRKISPLD
jgi:hypothetical protein